jgi:iron(III) transport system permease protein
MAKHRLSSLLLLAFFGLFMVYPLSHVLWRAFFLDGRGSLSFFGVMFSTELYREVLINSLNIAIAVTAISTAISYPLALVMARLSLPCAGLLHAILLSPLVVPPFVGVLGIRQLLSRFGSLNVLLMDLGLIEQPIRWLGSANVFGIIALQVIHR